MANIQCLIMAQKMLTSAITTVRIWLAMTHTHLQPRLMDVYISLAPEHVKSHSVQMVIHWKVVNVIYVRKTTGVIQRPKMANHSPVQMNLNILEKNHTVLIIVIDSVAI